MGIDVIFNAHNWSVVPFHFWSAAFFTLGCITGSFLNVCIYRMPLEQSVVSPPSHCPHCNYSIPFLSEHSARDLARVARQMQKLRSADFIALLHRGTAHPGLAFLSCCGLKFGDVNHPRTVRSPSRWLNAIFLAGLICATFIDFEHFIIIPDEITLGRNCRWLRRVIFIAIAAPGKNQCRRDDSGVSLASWLARE